MVRTRDAAAVPQILGFCLAVTVGVVIGCVWLLAGWPLVGRQVHGWRRAALITLRAVLIAPPLVGLQVLPWWTPWWWTAWAGTMLAGGLGWLTWLGRPGRVISAQPDRVGRPGGE